jgi:glutamine synthetase
MLGSSASVAPPNVMLNTAVAEVLSDFADILEGADDFNEALHALIRKTITDHKRIIFNGNGYDNAWVEEAKRRGLINHPTTPDAVAHLADEKYIELFTKHRVFSREELISRRHIMLSSYCKVNNIEALTMSEMVEREFVPAICKYTKFLIDSVLSKRAMGLTPALDTSYEEEVAARLGAAGICVRGGLHCAPLAHRTLGTLEGGAVRISFGEDNTEKEIRRMGQVLETMG